jgi:uncharacterized protein (TIGR00251 family)
MARPTGSSADLAVRLQPRARKNEVAGARGGVVTIRVTAPPVDGRANEALCRLVAKRAAVARGAVTIVRGERARDKVVRVEGRSVEELRRALAPDSARG